MSRQGEFLRGSSLLLSFFERMASVSVVPATGLRDRSGNSAGVDKLPDEMNDMKIRDDKVHKLPSPLNWDCLHVHHPPHVDCLVAILFTWKENV